MSEVLEFVVRTVLIGIGATIVMDLWAAIQQRCFGVPSLNYAMVGRWLGHMPRGRLVHRPIGEAAPVGGEGVIGWGAHYAIGVIFAGLLVGTCGLEWARHPTVLPAIAAGILTLAAPFFLLQPGMGAGIAASRTPNPNIARLRSLIAHTAFGIGLYTSALLSSLLIRG